MKDFIVNSGRILIDIGAWIVLLIIIVSAFVTFDKSPFIGMGILFVGTIVFVSAYYFLYLFIDIRDKLNEILEQIQEQ